MTGEGQNSTGGNFGPASSTVDFPAMEKDVLSSWQKRDIFRKSLEARENGPEFVFYDGPPFATGLPHYGHLLAGTVKDVVPRYKSMRGYYVERRFGWDCHGLPVEYEAEQSLGMSSKSEIEKYGIDRFNEHCRKIVLRYSKEWREIVTRMGRWVDFANEYRTMDPEYMESIWWVFKSLWEKALIYEGQKIVPYCPRCATPLSNFETNQGYADITDPAVTVRFPLKGEERTWILAWTTTPWTLPSNLALAVGADIVYAKIRTNGCFYYLAEDRLNDWCGEEDECEVVEKVKGSDLDGVVYEPLFPYFAEMEKSGAFRVFAADFVSTEDGTGIVHIAPGFGEDDHALGVRKGLPGVCPVDEEGRFTAEISDYAGRSVRDTNPAIVERLKDEQKLLRLEKITHSYPHCWRCESPLIYRAISTWFIKVEEIKEQLLRANKDVCWMPGHLKNGRFGKWIEGARDWAISRNRFWGTPLPVWRSEDGEESVCVGSIDELRRESGGEVKDLHKHAIDDVTIPSGSGKGKLRRVPQVLDCWFESGAMPYAQAHYPFENKEHFENNFPADFIAEGVDQTRGWFYTLMVLSTALFDRPAFRNVVVNGLVLAEDGRKMSKRLKNYPDPVYIINTYGGDALRLYMLGSAVVKAEDLRFSEEGVAQVVKNVLIPLWNAHSFFVTYANIDGWCAPGINPGQSDNILDLWICSCLQETLRKVEDAMERYDLQNAVRPLGNFVESLTNWYIRRSRRRFWKSSDDEDKNMAYGTLYYVLTEFCRLTAPFAPFISESVYANLRTDAMPESVHLAEFPRYREELRDEELEKSMSLAMTVVKLGRMLRTRNDLKVRQPLSRLYVATGHADAEKAVRSMGDIISDELNVKGVEVKAGESDFVDYSAKANFRRLGPRLGPKVKAVAACISKMRSADVSELLDTGQWRVKTEGTETVVGVDDVVVSRAPKEGLVAESEGGVAVALETALTEELAAEGIAREFVHVVQNLRKSRRLDVTRRIAVEYNGGKELKKALEAYRDHVCTEILCIDLRWTEEAPPDGQICGINGLESSIRILPVKGGKGGGTG
ncbi:MAG: isoleucine--tRNA ligase [Kiritimatiellia bacterium]